MDKVFVLVHEYEFDEGRETKMLGAYSSQEKADEAIERYFKLDGFRDYPKACFWTYEMDVDVDEDWREGFESASDENVKRFVKLTDIVNSYTGITQTAAEAWDDKDYYFALCEISYILRTEDEEKIMHYINKVLRENVGTELEEDECRELTRELMNL